MTTKLQQTNARIILLTAALIASFVLFSIPASAGDQSASSGVKYAVLFVSPGPNGKQVHVSRRTNGNQRTTVHRDKSAYKAIKWAIKHGWITAILKGEYQLSNPIDIKRDRRTIIVPPDVALAYKSDEDSPPTIPLIKVVRADNCRVFTLGRLEQTGNTQEAVFFQGHRKDGKAGIDGGLLFGTSEVRNMGSAYIAIGTENLYIPLAMGSNYGQMLVGCEGNDELTIGTLAGLGTKEGEREGELIDLNAFNKNVTIDRVIGTSPMVGDEIVDINHAHHVTVKRLQSFLGTDRPGRNPVGLDLYGSPGYHDWTNRRKRLGGGFQKSKHVSVRHRERIQKEVENFDRTVTLPGFPESLPGLRIKVHLTVNFTDGRSRTLIDRTYRYDLTSNDL